MRGVNEIGSAYSETYNFNIEQSRGLKILQKPNEIEFGRTGTYTYKISSFPGVTYEWEAPPGWKINGGGNQASGENMHTVSIAPSFCDAATTKSSIRFRFIKDT